MYINNIYLQLCNMQDVRTHILMHEQCVECRSDEARGSEVCAWTCPLCGLVMLKGMRGIRVLGW